MLLLRLVVFCERLKACHVVGVFVIVVLVVVIFRAVVVCIRSGTTTGVVSTLVDGWDIRRRMGTRDHLFARTFVERRRARRGTFGASRGVVICRVVSCFKRSIAVTAKCGCAVAQEVS